MTLFGHCFLKSSSSDDFPHAVIVAVGEEDKMLERGDESVEWEERGGGKGEKKRRDAVEAADGRTAHNNGWYSAGGMASKT